MTASLPSPAVLGARAFAALSGINRFSDEPGKLTRLYLSPSHRQAAEYVKGAMEVAGLTAFIDAAGSVQGRREGRTPGLPAVLIGSHIDTVRDGGRYDGNLGVVAGILAVQAIRDAGITLPFALEVVAFGDEETVRFPTSLSTSSALVGHYDPTWLDARDADGVVLRDALVAFGGDPAGIAALARKPGSVKAYLEVHIEQGPVLEIENEAVGIVTAINAQSRARVRVTGEAGHAGTVPMRLRKDALTAAAEMALALEEIARGHDQAVGTVGVFRPDPGATNVVPGAVDFTIDYRAPRARPSPPWIAKSRSASTRSRPDVASASRSRRIHARRRHRWRPSCRRPSPPASPAPVPISRPGACPRARGTTPWRWRGCAPRPCCSCAARRASAIRRSKT